LQARSADTATGGCRPIVVPQRTLHAVQTAMAAPPVDPHLAGGHCVGLAAHELKPHGGELAPAAGPAGPGVTGSLARFLAHQRPV